MATRNSRKTFDPCLLPWFFAGVGGGQTTTPYLSILVNNVKIEGKATDGTPPQFIAKAMAVNGGVAYLVDVNEWAEYTPVGKNDRYGFPKKIKLKGDGGYLSDTIDVDDNIHIYPANAEFYAPVNEIIAISEELAELKKNIYQNYDALKQATVIEYDDPDISKDVELAEKQRLAGASTVKLQRKMGTDGVELKQFMPNAQCYIAEYTAREEILYQRLDNVTGVAKLGEKGERRISGEIDLAMSSASSIIDMIISSINAYAKYYGDDVHASRGYDEQIKEDMIKTNDDKNEVNNDGI